MIYKFSSLASMADYFSNTAKRFREQEENETKPKQSLIYRIEAATWEAAAAVVRNAVIEQ